MNRRSFLAAVSGLLLPVPEPIRTYAFAPAGGWTRFTANRTLTLGRGVRGETLTIARSGDRGKTLTLNASDWELISWEPLEGAGGAEIGLIRLPHKSATLRFKASIPERPEANPLGLS